MLKWPWCSLHKIRFQIKQSHCDDHRSIVRSAKKAQGMSILKVRLQYFCKPFQGLYTRLVFKHLQKILSLSTYGHLQSWFEISCDSCHWRKFYLHRHCRHAWDQWFDAAFQEQNRSSICYKTYCTCKNATCSCPVCEKVCIQCTPCRTYCTTYHSIMSIHTWDLLLNFMPTSWRIPSSSP